MSIWPAVFTALALAIGLFIREWAKAAMAYRLGDRSVKLAGRMPPRLKAAADPFGTYVLPGLILILIFAGKPILPPFAYAKPLEYNSAAFLRRTRGIVLVSLAGPVANVILAGIAGLALRLGLGAGPPGQAVFWFLWSNIFLAVLHLMPVPGLDGGSLLALVLPGRPKELFQGLEPYLVLFIIAIFFLLGQILLLPIVGALAGVVCDVLAGSANCGVGF